MAEELVPRDYQAEADAYLARATANLPPEESALALAVFASRVATRLHSLARSESGARKGAPDWPGWAALHNATRTLVLQASTCRDLATRLARRRR